MRIEISSRRLLAAGLLSTLCCLVACGGDKQQGSMDLTSSGGDGAIDQGGGDGGGGSGDGGDLASQPDQAATDLLPAADLFTCPDDDSDGRSPVAGCTATVDCDDHDADNWDSCSSCVDVDGDGYFTGCDRYKTRLPDCDDTDVLVSHTPESFDSIGTDADCDGRMFALDDAQTVFVSADGDDTANGTRAAPVKTLTRGLELAVGERRVVALGVGSFGSLTLTSSDRRSLSLIGKLDPTTWLKSSVGGPAGQTQLGDVTVSGPSTPGKAQQKILGLSDVSLNGTSFLALTNTDAVVSAKGITDVTISGGSFRGQLAAQHLTCAASTVELTSPSIASNSANGVFANTGCALTVTGGLIYSNAGGTFTALDVSSGASLEANGLTISLADNLGQLGCVGISVGDGPATILNTTIETCSVGTTSAGVRGNGSGAITLVNSVIKPIATGNGKGAVAVHTTNNPVVILNNRLDVGTRSSGGVVELSAPGASALYNNSLVREDNGSGLLVSGTASVTLRNNAIAVVAANCLVDAGGCVTAIADVNNCGKWTGCGTSSSNLAGACTYDSTDHIASSEPVCKSAGTDPSTAYAAPILDVDGVTRPLGIWDIGPDEITD